MSVLVVSGCEKEPRPELDPDPSPESSESGVKSGETKEPGGDQGSTSGQKVSDAERQALFEKVQARGETMLQRRYEVDLDQVTAGRFTFFERTLAEEVDPEKWQARRDGGELVITWDSSVPEMMNAINQTLEEASELETREERSGEVVIGLADEEALREEALQLAVDVVRQRLEAMKAEDYLVLVEGGDIVVEGSAAGLGRSPIEESRGSLSIALALQPQESRPLLEPLAEAVGDGNLLMLDASTGSLKGFPGLSGKEDPCEGLRELADSTSLGDRWRGYEADENQQGQFCRLWLRQEPPILDPVAVMDAFPAANKQTGLPYLSMELVPSHAQVFAEFTANHVGELTLVALGDEVLLAPMIRSKIPGGKLSVEFGSAGSKDEQLKRVTDLAISVRAGSLPAPLKPVSEVRIDSPAP